MCYASSVGESFLDDNAFSRSILFFLHLGNPLFPSLSISWNQCPRGRPASLLLLAKIVRTPLSTLEPGYPAPGPTWLSLHLSRPSMPRRSPMLSRSGSGRGPDRQCASADHPC